MLTPEIINQRQVPRVGAIRVPPVAAAHVVDATHELPIRKTDVVMLQVPDHEMIQAARTGVIIVGMIRLIAWNVAKKT
jgi:hypothetical protein